jgi:pyruvate,orthophosphate dikinase
MTAGSDPVPKYVYDFTEGNKDLKDLLGGKGANLSEMTNLGLPVHPGSSSRPRRARPTWSRDRARGAARRGERAPRLARAGDGKSLGPGRRPAAGLGPVRGEVLHARDDGDRPHIGLNDNSVAGLAKQSGSERFAWDSYRRLLQMFGKTVLGIDGEHFEDASRRRSTPRAPPTTST